MTSSDGTNLDTFEDSSMDEQAAEGIDNIKERLLMKFIYKI